jgi:hypothetical protein
MDDDAKALYKMARARIMKEMTVTSAEEQATSAMQPLPTTELPSPTLEQLAPAFIFHR